MEKSAQKLFDVTFGGSETDGQFRAIKKSVWQDGEQFVLLNPTTPFSGLYSHPDRETIYTKELLHVHLVAEARDYFSEKWAAMGYDKFAD